MGSDFQYNQKLQNVKQYYQSLKSNTVNNYIQQISKQKNLQSQKLNNIVSIYQNYQKFHLSQAWKTILLFNKTDTQSDSPNKKQFPKISSAQSQRIKSTGSKKGSQNSQDFNLQLTAKTKNSKNPFLLSKQDSLLYSAADDFDTKINNNNSQNNQSMTKLDYVKENNQNNLQFKEFKEQKQQKEYQEQEQKQQKQQEEVLKEQKQYKFDIDQKRKQIEEEQIKQELIENKSMRQESIDEKVIYESANFEKQQDKDVTSNIGKRVQTQNAIKKDKKNIKRFNKIDFSQIDGIGSQVSNQNNIFSTQINSYQSKITKLKEVKQLKKKKLLNELSKVNYQLGQLRKRQEQISINRGSGQYASRVKISNNKQANKKAEYLVKNLRSQKRNRNIAKIGQFKSLDKNINQYMDQLIKIRAQNQEKQKLKKKFQILERMKKNQIRKANDQKKKQQTLQFMHKLKVEVPQSHIPKLQSPKRSPTKITEENVKETSPKITPQLPQKKSHMYKIRSVSIKKSHKDLYEQALS